MNESNNLMETLGIEFTHVSDGRVEATMPIKKHVCQPFGILHGGASIALAESAAGKGSLFNCQPGEMPAGFQVSCNHIASAKEGETLNAIATIKHKGKTTHLWNVEISTSEGKLISSVRVLNMILRQG